MIIYVAGASAEPERVRYAMDEVVANGWVLAQDWLKDIQLEGSANHVTEEKRAHYAQVDLKAVARSDVFWLLAPKERTSGAWVEFGAALVREDVVVVVSGPFEQSIFCSLADKEFSDDRDVLKWLELGRG